MRCKVGDIAIVIKADYPELIGRTVEVLARCPASEGDWFVELLGGRPAIIAGFATCSADDDALLPIAGPRFNTETTQDEPIKEVA